MFYTTVRVKKNLVYFYENCYRQGKIWNKENCVINQAITEVYQLPLTILNICKKNISWKWQYKLNIYFVINQNILDIFISRWAGHNHQNKKWPLAGICILNLIFKETTLKFLVLKMYCI